VVDNQVLIVINSSMQIRKYVPILSLAAIAACASSTQQNEAAALDQEIQTPLGNQVPVAASSLRITLTAVPEDSRCPTQVVCAWAGNARVLFSATEGSGTPVPFALNTTLDPKSADVLGYRIALLELTPVVAQPGDQIPTGQYRAKLRVVRLQR
jgi:hypothetical protein